MEIMFQGEIGVFQDVGWFESKLSRVVKGRKKTGRNVKFYFLALDLTSVSKALVKFHSQTQAPMCTEGWG